MNGEGLFYFPNHLIGIDCGFLSNHANEKFKEFWGRLISSTDCYPSIPA